MDVDLSGADTVPYLGNITACHSLAMLSAYFSNVQVPDIDLFEALTTVPFGLVSVREDPNRVLNVWCDPDIGLDRACTALGLAYDVSWWPKDASPDAALQQLRGWVSDGPIVIGPLNMDALTYLFERQLYRMCDHYLVVWGIDREGWWVSDNERSVSEVLREAALIDAWRGDRIPEGRGAFVMRRLRAAQAPVLT
ncbi:MAG: BtrH N-terminal domain-containing protein, partial [bacterium]|nr:BtrH N-terminal domain-containing protein [bacterium]